MLTVLRAAIAPRKPPVGLPSAICILIQSPNDPGLLPYKDSH